MASRRGCAAGVSDPRDVSIASVRAPAKINLGLEILGKRRDGYHEIRSVLAKIDMHDDLHFSLGRSGNGMSSIDGVATADNLIDRAIGLVQSRSGFPTRIGYELKKRIPIAAGLGGASSDAASTLTATNKLLGNPLTHEDLVDLAGRLGSDVPFFLGGPAAAVGGTGTRVDPVPTISASVLLIIPRVAIPGKTAALYNEVSANEYSPGHRIERTVERLRAGVAPEPADLRNAFTAPLYQLLPWLAILPDLLRSCGCCRFGISGAGPAHYALLDPAEFANVTSQVRSGLDPERFDLYQTSLLPNRTQRPPNA